MVKRVGMGLYFLGLVLALWERVVWQHIGLRRSGKCRDLNLLLRCETLPSVLLFLDFHASRFLPNKLDQRRTQLDTSVRLLQLVI